MHAWHRDLAAVLLTLSMSAAAPVAARGLNDLRGMAPITGNAAAGKANATVCSACHGADGQSIVPQFPNLAGQSATYLYVQMLAFRSGQRSNATMQAQLAALNDGQLRDLAAYFAALPPAPTGNPDVASRGGVLYHAGDAQLGIPACQGCHGVDGRGPQPDATSRMPSPAWATFPTLAGQNAEYVAAELKKHQDGTRHGSTNDRIMHGVGHGLRPADIAALAAYVASM